MKTCIFILSNPIVVSSSTAALTSSARTLLSTTKLQPVLTSKAPQPTYMSALHFQTVLPRSSQYKPRISPEPAVSMTPEFSPSVTPTSSAKSEHTTVYQTTSLTPSVSPANAHPIAGNICHFSRINEIRECAFLVSNNINILLYNVRKNSRGPVSLSCQKKKKMSCRFYAQIFIFWCSYAYFIFSILTILMQLDFCWKRSYLQLSSLSQQAS